MAILTLTESLTTEEELYWLALRMVPGHGTRRMGLLLEKMQTPQAIFRASARGTGRRGLERGRGALGGKRMQF